MKTRIQLKANKPALTLVFDVDEFGNFKIKENTAESDPFFTLVEDGTATLKEESIICPHTNNTSGIGSTSQPWGEVWSHLVKCHVGTLYTLTLVNGKRPYLKITDGTLYISNNGIDESPISVTTFINRSRPSTFAGYTSTGSISNIFSYTPEAASWETIDTGIEAMYGHGGFPISFTEVGIVHPRILSDSSYNQIALLYTIDTNTTKSTTNNPTTSRYSIACGFPIDEVGYVFADEHNEYSSNLNKAVVTKYQLSDETWSVEYAIGVSGTSYWVSDKTCEYISEADMIVLGVDNSWTNWSQYAAYLRYDTVDKIIAVLYTSTIAMGSFPEPIGAALPSSLLKYVHPTIYDFNPILLTETTKGGSLIADHTRSSFTDVVLQEERVYFLAGGTYHSLAEVYNYTTDTCSSILDLPTNGLVESYNFKR